MVAAFDIRDTPVVRCTEYNKLKRVDGFPGIELNTSSLHLRYPRIPPSIVFAVRYPKFKVS